MANTVDTAQHFGINVFSPTGTGPQGTKDQVIFTTKYPFAKLDTQNPVSFQNLSIFFNTDPPNPVTTGTVVTQVYQFAHGYKYVPTYWVLFQNNNGFNDPSAFTYGNEGSVINAASLGSNAILQVRVDQTFFYIDVAKFWDTAFPGPTQIIGFTIMLRIYIFTEPAVLTLS